MKPIDRVIDFLELEVDECPEPWMKEGLDEIKELRERITIRSNRMDYSGLDQLLQPFGKGVAKDMAIQMVEKIETMKVELEGQGAKIKDLKEQNSYLTNQSESWKELNSWYNEIKLKTGMSPKEYVKFMQAEIEILKESRQMQTEHIRALVEQNEEDLLTLAKIYKKEIVELKELIRELVPEVKFE